MEFYLKILGKGFWKIKIVNFFRNFGSSIFFKGLEAKLLQSIVTAGFMFLAYEKILFMTQKAMGLKAR
jgi:hypothetical protein